MLLEHRVHIREDEHGYNYSLYPMEKQEYDNFEHDIEQVIDPYTDNIFLDKWGFNKRHVISYGETTIKVNYKNTDRDEYKAEVEYYEDLFKSILGTPSLVHNAFLKKNVSAYPCFCCKDFNIPTVLYHTTAVESWNCFIQSIKAPKYCIITRIKKEDEHVLSENRRNTIQA